MTRLNNKIMLFSKKLCKIEQSRVHTNIILKAFLLLLFGRECVQMKVEPMS